MSVFCVKNQWQVVVDISLLCVHILPEATEKETASKVGGNYKNICSGLYLWQDFIQFLKVSGMPAATLTERVTWTWLADTWVDVFRLCSCLMGQEQLCVNCRVQHIDYSLLKLCSLKKACYRYTVGQLLWRDAAVLYCTIGITFG